MTSTLPTHKILNTKTGVVHEGWLYSDTPSANRLACGSPGLYGPARRAYRMCGDLEVTCKRCVKAVAAMPPAEETPAAPELAKETSAYSILVTYRVTCPPFANHTYLIPMRVVDPHVRAVRDEIAKGLGIDASHVELAKIKTLESPAPDTSGLDPVLGDLVEVVARTPEGSRTVYAKNGDPAGWALRWWTPDGTRDGVRAFTAARGEDVVLQDRTMDAVHSWLKAREFYV